MSISASGFGPRGPNLGKSKSAGTPDPKREEKVPDLSRFQCNHTVYFSQANGEYMVTFESSLPQVFCFSLRVFDMQKLMMQ